MESILLVDQASRRAAAAAAEPGGSPRATQTPLWKFLVFLVLWVHFPCIFSAASQGPEVELPLA